jgi:hypothetical protein
VRPRLLVRLFLPKRAKRQCVAAGMHKPVLIDLGRSKLCMNCGQW